MSSDSRWLLGNSVEQPQWESSNSSVSFPLADDSLPQGFPTEAIVDACVVVTNEVTPSDAKVELGCLHFSAHLVSAMLFVGGEPALACSAHPRSYEPYTPVAMESLKDGCSGVITFGNIMSVLAGMPSSRGSYTFRGRIPLSEAAVVRPVVGRLRKFLKVATGQSASGDVGVELPPGVSMRVGNESGVSTVDFSITDEARSAIDAVCAGVIDSGMVPITSINGVYPDALGRIAIVFGDPDGEPGGE